MPDVVAEVVKSVPRFVIPAGAADSPKPEAKAPEAPAPVVETKAPAAETPATQPEAKTGDDPAQPPAKKGESGEQRRMFRAIRQAAEAKARAEAAERELNDLRQKSVAEKPKPGAPRMEDFTDISEYAKAVEKHAAEYTRKELEDKQREFVTRKHHETLAADWESKVDEAVSKYEGFMEKVGELNPANPFHRAIMGSDPVVAWHLANDRKEVIRILNIPDPVAQAREIGRLEAKLLATPEAPPKPSKAPKPIEPVTGGATVSEGIKPNQSPEEYIKGGVGAKLFRGKR